MLSQKQLQAKEDSLSKRQETEAGCCCDCCRTVGSFGGQTDGSVFGCNARLRRRSHGATRAPGAWLSNFSWNNSCASTRRRFSFLRCFKGFRLSVLLEGTGCSCAAEVERVLPEEQAPSPATSAWPCVGRGLAGWFLFFPLRSRVVVMLLFLLRLLRRSSNNINNNPAQPNSIQLEAKMQRAQLNSAQLRLTQPNSFQGKFN